MNRFYLLTLQWTTSCGATTRSWEGNVSAPNPQQAFQAARELATEQGAADNSVVLFFYLGEPQ